MRPHASDTLLFFVGTEGETRGTTGDRAGRCDSECKVRGRTLEKFEARLVMDSVVDYHAK